MPTVFFLADEWIQCELENCDQMLLRLYGESTSASVRILRENNF